MDDADIANDFATRFNQDAIDRVRQERGSQISPGAEYCEWCGAEIPAARRAAMPGCGLCVDCQAVKERLKNGL